VSRKVSVERIISAPPERIFDVLADPRMHPRIDGSGSVRGALRQAPDRLHEGARFSMSMRLGVPYVIRNRVVEFEENRLIAWRHVGQHRWRWELEPVEGGTRVVHTFDWSTVAVPFRLYIEGLGWPERNLRGMRETIVRLDELVTGGA
jgi:uncharacterized protein YndB with AHSA1/START domain